MSDRREFMKRAGLAVPITLAGAALAPAQEDKDPAAAAVRSLLEIVRVRHGKHLTEAQLKTIQQALARSVTSAAIMKRTRLENGDEPAFAFFADLDG